MIIKLSDEQVKIMRRALSAFPMSRMTSADNADITDIINKIDNPQSPRILVTVEGGCVGSVLMEGVNESDIECRILDWDPHDVGEADDPLPLWTKPLLNEEAIKKWEEGQEEAGAEAWATE